MTSEEAGQVEVARELLTRALKGPLLPAQQQQVRRNTKCCTPARAWHAL